MGSNWSTKKVQMGQHGFKGVKWDQMGPHGSIGSKWVLGYCCTLLAWVWQFLGNFGQGAHDDVWRYIVPCGGERLALQSLIPRHWIHPTFQGQPMIILPILIPSASSCKPSLRITEKVKRDHNPFFSFSYFLLRIVESWTQDVSHYTSSLVYVCRWNISIFLSSSSSKASLTSSGWEWDTFHMYGSIHQSELPAQEWARQVTPSAAYYSCRPLPGSPILYYTILYRVTYGPWLPIHSTLTPCPLSRPMTWFVRCGGLLYFP